MLLLQNLLHKTPILLAAFCIYICPSRISALDVVQQLLDCDSAAALQKDITGCSWSVAYNAKTLARFDTKTGRLLLENSAVQSEVDSLNKDKKALQNIQNEMQENLDLISRLLDAGNATLDRKVPPSVTIDFHDLEAQGHPSQLQCTLTGFYPKALNVTWLKNGVAIPHEVVQTPILPNSDGTFQTIALVNIDPRRLETYTCSVEGSSVPGGFRLDWDPHGKSSLTPGAIVGILFGIAGICTLVAGCIVLRKGQGGLTHNVTATVAFSKDQPQRKSNRSETSVRTNTSASSANSGDGLTRHMA